MKTKTGKSTSTPILYETENDISEKRRLELNALMNERLVKRSLRPESTVIITELRFPSHVPLVSAASTTNR